MVAPFAGAWIEIADTARLLTDTNVAPFAGAWIEIATTEITGYQPTVAPFAGAWIEMPVSSPLSQMWETSLPSRERG